MPKYLYTIVPSYHVVLEGITALCIFGLFLHHATTASASEHVNTHLMLRQLATLEDTAHRSAQITDDPSKRYSFDYQRLAEDIAKIRQGLQDYLSPTRAQPRDPVELSGDYTTEARTP